MSQRFAAQLVALFVAMVGSVMMGCRSEHGVHSSSASENGRPLAGSDSAIASQEPDSTSVDAETQRGAAALQLAVQWLDQHQHDDGLWRSQAYGNLREGAAISSLVLYAFAHLPEQLRPLIDVQFTRAASALSRTALHEGYITNPEGADYANYATAMFLVAVRRWEHQLPDGLEMTLVEFMVRSQLDEQEGFAPDHVEYGGWDMDGWMEGPRPTTGTNISVSVFALEALQPYQSQSVLEAKQRAAAWLPRCQGEDGGHFFHPRRSHDGNKALWLDAERQQPRTYGSTTADGLRAIAYLVGSEGLAAEVHRNANDDNIATDPKVTADDDWDAKMSAAAKWLSDRPGVAVVPGFPDDPQAAGWAEGLRFYYLMSLAKSLEFLPRAVAEERANEIVEWLVDAQRPDGSWKNPHARMREDDPMIATSFAIIALAAVLEHQASQVD